MGQFPHCVSGVNTLGVSHFISGRVLMNIPKMKVSQIVCASFFVYLSVIVGFVVLNYKNTAFWTLLPTFGQAEAEVGKVDQISSILNQVVEQIFGEMSDDSKGFVKSMVSQGVEMTKDWDWEKIQNTVSDYLPSEEDLKAAASSSELTDSGEIEDLEEETADPVESTLPVEPDLTTKEEI